MEKKNEEEKLWQGNDERKPGDDVKIVMWILFSYIFGEAMGICGSLGGGQVGGELDI